MRIASVAEVMRMLREGKVVRDVRVDEPFRLHEHIGVDAVCRFPVRFVGCRLAAVDVAFASYEDHVVSFERCHLESLSMMSAFFKHGLVLDGCRISGHTDISCGGHNDYGDVCLVDTDFMGFAVTPILVGNLGVLDAAEPVVH